MTIAAGFLFNGGVILCADTLETITGVSKKWAPKLIVEPIELIGKDLPEDLMIAMAGAGDSAFIEKVVQRAWEDARQSASLDEACITVEESIKATSQEYGQIFQPGYMLSADLIYGIKMQGESKLFSTRGPVVNESRGWPSVGAGYYPADFLAFKTHQRYLPCPQVLLLAAYVISQCKSHVDGCGGDTHIAVLHDTGKSVRLDPWRTEFATQQLSKVDQVVSTLLLYAADFNMKTTDFNIYLDAAIEALKHIRSTGDEFRDAWEEFTKNSLKAFTPPISQS